MIHYEIHVWKKHGLNGIRHVLLDISFGHLGSWPHETKLMTRYDNLII